jgi:hypothetical protein
VHEAFIFALTFQTAFSIKKNGVASAERHKNLILRKDFFFNLIFEMFYFKRILKRAASNNILFNLKNIWLSVIVSKGYLWMVTFQLAVKLSGNVSIFLCAVYVFRKDLHLKNLCLIYGMES